ncbi:MAG: DUF418 domain-containing protein [Pseudomonadota bacterium]
MDAVRGFAVAGIVLMNIFFFSMPSAAYFNPRAWGGMETIDLGLWTTSFLFIEDKMRGLFAMLFGASVLLMMEHSSHAAPLRQHYLRMAWLLMIGLAHAILLANNDILRLYAICGFMLPLFAGMSARGLFIACGLFLTIHMIAGGYVSAVWISVYYDVQAGLVSPESIAPAERAFGADPKALNRQVTRNLGDYQSIVAARIANPLGLAFAALVFLPVTLSTMLFGMGLYRTGFFAVDFSDRLLRKMAVWGFALGLPVLAGLAFWNFTEEFAAVIVASNALVWSAPADLAVSAGCAALLMIWIKRMRTADIVRRFAAAGRMALTNYIATSLICGVIFFGYGGGLFGAISRPEAYLFALVPIGLMLGWSLPWLNRFRYGPIEWLWRSLARGHMQQMKGPAK